MFTVLSSCLLYPIITIQSHKKVYRDKNTRQNLKSVLNQNVNVT